MKGLSIRLARPSDVEELVQMRRDFKLEDEDGAEDVRNGYEADCRSFLEGAIAGRNWQIWVADLTGSIVAHVFVALVDKVPSPLEESGTISYLTNVYTRAEYRGKGIGTRLLKQAQQCADEARAELMIVWPSEKSVPFYERQGFQAPDEPMIWTVGT